MLASDLKLTYQQLVGFLKESQQSGLSVSQLQPQLAFSDTLLNHLKHNPDPWVAQLLLPKASLPFTVNLMFNCAVMTALMGLRNQVNDTCNQQMVAAVLTCIRANYKLIEKQQSICISAQAEKQLRALSSKVDNELVGVWQATVHEAAQIIQFAHKPTQDISSNNKVVQLCALACSLGHLLTPVSGKATRRFDTVLTLITQHITGRQLTLLEPMLMYPGVMPPGTLIKLSDARHGVVLSVCQSTLRVKVLKKDPEHHEIVDIVPAAVKSVLPLRKQKGFSQAEAWWDNDWRHWYSKTGDYAEQEFPPPLTAFHSTYRLDKPPQVLMEIQSHLRRDNIDFNKLAGWIAQEPSLASFLNQSASQASRSKLPIIDVKHGLMMHGYLRSNSLLIQQALLLRLNQHYFPLQETFIQFTRLRATIAGNLMALKDKTLQESVSALASFACAGLFSVPALKGAITWSVRPERSFDSKYLASESIGTQVHQHAIKLAEAWSQEPAHIMALRNHAQHPTRLPAHKIAGKLSVVLGLSLILTRQIYFAFERQCPDTQSYSEGACAYLGIPPSQLSSVIEQSCQLYPVFRPLLYKRA